MTTQRDLYNEQGQTGQETETTQQPGYSLGSQINLRTSTAYPEDPRNCWDANPDGYMVEMSERKRGYSSIGDRRKRANEEHRNKIIKSVERMDMEPSVKQVKLQRLRRLYNRYNRQNPSSNPVRVSLGVSVGVGN